MDASFDLQPMPKKPKTLVTDKNNCLFCSKPFTSKATVTKPDLSRLDSLFGACRERGDDIGNMILGNASDISSGRVPIVYHRNCRSSYCSAYHIQRVVSKRSFSGVDSSGDAGSANDDNALFTRSRSSTPTFDWKISCFICGEQCNPKHRSTWSMVEVAVQHEPGAQNMYTKMVVAARRRWDQTMLTRLYAVTNGDLVAVEARYHRQKGCYSHYSSEKHIYAHQADVTAESTYKEVIRSLVEEFLPAIMDEKQVFYLTTLKSRFQELLLGTEIDNPHAYKSYNLKKQLLQECPNLAFISQPGMSDFVCSNDISVGDALKKVSELVSVIKELSDEQQGLDSAERSCVSEESIVHTAVGILRRRLHKSKYQTENYYSSEEMNIESLKDFVDPLLYKAVGWLTDGKLYSEATDIRETDSLQCLSIACDITTLATSVASPKHLGLAVDLHHRFGSRKLVECISALGYCISYSELRRFLTSAAIHVSSIQTSPAGCFIPPQLVSKSDGGKIVIGVGDNWDHNERTVDGKRTTHAMTSILVSPTVDTDKSSPTISRAASRSLDIHSITGGDLSLVLPYRKPTERPEPVLQPPPTADDLELNQNDMEYNGACTTEMLYNILRSGDFGDFAIPPWAQYHNCISTDRTPQSVSTVAFNPIIMEPPNDYATIYTTLMRFKDVSSTLGHSQIPVCFDMGLLTKALEIVWAHPKELPGVIPFKGEMHFLLSVFSGIGFLDSDSDHDD